MHISWARLGSFCHLGFTSDPDVVKSNMFLKGYPESNFTLLCKSGQLSHISVTLVTCFRDNVNFYFSAKQKYFAMSQIHGSCGHVKASWDNHTTCFSCSRCSFETRCSNCKECTSAIVTLAAKRRTSMGRKKSTDDKKRDMGASVTLETVRPAVKGSSDNCNTGWGFYWEVTVLGIVSV